MRIAHWMRVLGLAGMATQLWARSDESFAGSQLWEPLVELGLERHGWASVCTVAAASLAVIGLRSHGFAALVGVGIYACLGVMWLVTAPFVSAGVLALVFAIGSAVREIRGVP